VVLDGFQLRDGKLYGGAEFVPDAEGADRLLVLADDTLALAPNGLIGNRSPWWTTRSLATVSADGAAAEVLGRVDVHALRDRAAVAIACDSLGVAQAMLDATVAYAKVRNQFGRSDRSRPSSTPAPTCWCRSRCRAGSSAPPSPTVVRSGRRRVDGQGARHQHGRRDRR
jgi:hypothetical protein